jgi:hypothetical protein
LGRSGAGESGRQPYGGQQEPARLMHEQFPDGSSSAAF